MRKYLYIKELDVYLTPDGYTVTEDQLTFFDTVEREWKESQKDYTFQELIEIFPEAISAARKGLKEKQKHYRSVLTLINKLEEDYQNNVINPAHFKEQEYLQEKSKWLHGGMRAKAESKLKTIAYQLSHLDVKEGRAPQVQGNGVTELQIAQAKAIPIENFYDGKLLKRNKRAIGKCPFHQDDTPSLMIYLQQNTFYCYSCNAGGSVIDFVMKQRGSDFLSTVKFLLSH